MIANDISEWSRIFGLCYLKNTLSAAHYQPLLDHLNALEGKDGWFTEHYGGVAEASILNESSDSDVATVIKVKKPWQIHNTRKLDAIREEIDRLALSETERSVVLASLILALDRVDSTLGHFSSYLNDWSARSYKTMRLEVPHLLASEAEHTIHKGDIFETVPNVQADLAYFDPPYGSNNEKMPPSRVRYAAYYHLWTTICLNDRPHVFGKVARRKDSQDTAAASVFEEFRQNDNGGFIAIEALHRLLSRTNTRYILLSYSSGGRATAEDLHDILAESGKILDIRQIDYKRNVMAQMRWTNAWIREAESTNHEFLFLIDKF
jgi:adenine-specific DNA-methyltransferase